MPIARQQIIFEREVVLKETNQSPLWLITREPLVNELVCYLADCRARIEASPRNVQHTLEFSRDRLRKVRAAFAEMIQHGEAKLHRLCELLGQRLFDGTYDVQSVVIGEVTTNQKRFSHSQRLSPATLYEQTDLDLGNRLLDIMRCHDGLSWERPRLIANFVEYQPHLENRYAIHKMISRIKAEEELWNKVCDEIFGLDTLVHHDKKLRLLGRYIKDVFGIKIVVGSPTDVNNLQEHLLELTWSAEALRRSGVPAQPGNHQMVFLEIKNYLGDSSRKKSGWEAMKSVVRWWDKTFEIQIQPLANYFLEREYLTQQSHAGFKERREALRNQVAEQMPLFDFYRNLLRWLFVSQPNDAAPTMDGITVVVRD